MWKWTLESSKYTVFVECEYEVALHMRGDWHQVFWTSMFCVLFFSVLALLCFASPFALLIVLAHQSFTCAGFRYLSFVFDFLRFPFLFSFVRDSLF